MESTPVLARVGKHAVGIELETSRKQWLGNGGGPVRIGSRAKEGREEVKMAWVYHRFVELSQDSLVAKEPN